LAVLLSLSKTKCTRSHPTPPTTQTLPPTFYFNPLTASPFCKQVNRETSTKTAVDASIKQENDSSDNSDASVAAAGNNNNDEGEKSQTSRGFNFAAAAGAGGVIVVFCAAVWFLVVRPKQQKVREAKRKTLEMECMNSNFAQIQKLAQAGSFLWQDANPAFDRESKLSAAVAATAADPAHMMDTHYVKDEETGEEIMIGYPKLHLLLRELGLQEFRDAFVAHGVHSTKHWFDLEAGAQDSILMKIGLNVDQCGRLLDKIEELKAHAVHQATQQRHANTQPARKGWKKRFSIVSKRHYFEHVDTGETQWHDPDEIKN
jgi:hypothetical protein